MSRAKKCVVCRERQATEWETARPLLCAPCYRATRGSDTRQIKAAARRVHAAERRRIDAAVSLVFVAQATPPQNQTAIYAAIRGGRRERLGRIAAAERAVIEEAEAHAEEWCDEPLHDNTKCAICNAVRALRAARESK